MQMFALPPARSARMGINKISLGLHELKLKRDGEDHPQSSRPNKRLLFVGETRLYLDGGLLGGCSVALPDLFHRCVASLQSPGRTGVQVVCRGRQPGMDRYLLEQKPPEMGMVWRRPRDLPQPA